MTAAMQKWRGWLPLLLILVLAASLRLTGLEYQSFWNDELSTRVRADLATLGELLDDGVRQDGHPPLYLMVIFFVEKTLGKSDFAVRLPSVVAGVLSVWLMYLLARRLRPEDSQRGRDEGWIAAAFMAVLWAPVYYSQEARPYALAILLAQVATYAYIPLLPRPGARPPGWRAVFGYALAALLVSYTHYFGFVLVVIQAAIAVLLAWVMRGWRTRIVAAYGAFVLGYAPWLVYLIGQVSAQFSDPLPRPAPAVLFQFLLHLFNNSRLVTAAALLVCAAAAATWAWRTLRSRTPPAAALGESWATLLLVGWLVLPPVLTVLESWVFLPIVTLRYLLLSLPAAYLLLARAFCALPLPRVGRFAASGLMAALCLFHLLGPMAYYTRPTKEQFREAAYYVAAGNAGYPEGLVVTNAWHADYLDHYFEEAGSPLRTDVLIAGPEDASVLDAALAQRRPRYVWYVSMHRATDPALLADLDNRMALIESRSFIGGSVRLYERSGR